MPTSATTHIQKIAPGPPMIRAVATPTMLPTPTREARDVENAWKPEIPSFVWCRVCFSVAAMCPKRRNCTARRRIVKYRPAPISM